MNGLFPGSQMGNLKLNGKTNGKESGKRKKRLRGGKNKVYAPIAEENAVLGVVNVNSVVGNPFLKTKCVAYDPNTIRDR